MIAQRLPLTLTLMITAEICVLTLALILGIISAVKQYSLLDNVITSFSFIGFSMPIFFIALGLMLIFAVKFKKMGWPYLPTGADIWDPEISGQLVSHMVLPVSALVIIQTANYSRFVRSSILEVLGLDYIRTARAKGLTERAVLYKHALRNAALPFVTIVGLDIPALLGGALVTEFGLRLARDGQAVLGICPARRFPGGQRCIADHFFCSGSLYHYYRCDLHLCRPANSFKLIRSNLCLLKP